MKNLALIDSVEGIVKQYGADILSDPKFWNILIDSYSFMQEPRLKINFKECIDSGYIKKILSCNNDRDVKNYISKIIKKCKTNSEKENYVGILFSIAIAKGISSRKDYIDYTSNLLNPQQKKKKAFKWKNKFPFLTKLSIKECIGIFFILFFGLIVTFGGTIFYRAFFRGFWLFFIVLLQGIGQLFYLIALQENIDDSKNNTFKEIVRSLLIPISFGIIINISLAFIFFIEPFRDWLGNFLGESREEGPYIITFFLDLAYAFFIIGGIFSCYRFDKSILKTINKKIVINISIIWFLGYLILFLIPLINNSIVKYRLNNLQKRYEAEYNLQVEKNNELVSNRSIKNIDLAFKGIKVGVLFETDYQVAEFITKNKELYESKYKIVVDGDGNPLSYIDSFDSNTYYNYKLEKNKDNIILDGHELSFITSLDNEKVKVIVYEYDSIVPFIFIRPDYSRNGEFEDERFKKIVDLYVSKYGEPELRMSNGNPFKIHIDIHDRFYLSDYFKDDYFKDKNNFVWTFQNGSIWLNKNRILYYTKEFYNFLENTNIYVKKNKENRNKFIEDSITKINQKLYQEEKVRKYNDSIQKIRNHENAINEI